MKTKEYDYISVENKWQNKWFENKIYEASKKNNKKFFIHFAYPGVSGYLHVGHMRGFTYCDIIARYKRMTGFDVLFPAGFHASGIPSIGFAKKVLRKDDLTIKILKDYGCTEETINNLSDPNEVVKYFGEIYVNDYWKKFGFLIDYSRIMSTISEGYKKFITWQFLKLKENNLLIQKPHFAPFCPKCGPIAVDKSETDISRGGSSQILEFTTIKFKLNDGTILPAATLRPETIFGVTNMWVNPDVEYTKVKIDDEIWICSKEAYIKLSYQIDNIEVLDGTVKGSDLIGKKCFVPIINREVPILSGPFADPTVATGIVMSVPAHAPFDWIALQESGEKINPIAIIDVKKFGTNPAKEVCDQLNIISQSETEKLKQATEEVYKKEFHMGVLNHKCGKYAGIKVSDIKDDVKNELIAKNFALIFREFSEHVICRCNNDVVIKKIPDQWFIQYSNEKLTSESKKHSKYMTIYPVDYYNELPNVLDWFDDRACIRKGSWLGTDFPFKKGWIIEPISDSTLYPCYYIISNFVNDGKLDPIDMTEEFFDFVFLGRGKTKNEIWNNIKSDFEYWYPVDINLGGKEHKTVHFPVFLMNHVAILPIDKRPKGIFVHWWVTQKGKEKISKSKGGAEHIAEAATKYGVDSMRLYYSHIGSPYVDVEWDPEAITKYKRRIENIWNLINHLEITDETKNENLDAWLISILNKHIKNVINFFEKYNLRDASNVIFFECRKDLRWYLERGGGNSKVLQNFVETWIKMMAPICPHLSEELWELNNFNMLVSNELYPNFDSSKISEKDEVGERLLSEVINDINEIKKVTKIIPKRIIIYTSPSWKKEIMLKSMKLADEDNLNMGKMIKDALIDPFYKNIAKQLTQYLSKTVSEIKKFSDSDKKRYLVDLNEKEYLLKSIDYLKKIYSCDVEIYSTDDKDIADPKNKSSYAIPLRPAIYLE